MWETPPYKKLAKVLMLQVCQTLEESLPWLNFTLGIGPLKTSQV